MVGNSASVGGGGASGGTLNYCTLTGNSALFTGGGLYFGALKNCIIYFNTASTVANNFNGTLSYCCTTPDPGGVGNFTSAPLFVDYAAGNLSLQSNSPCINSGLNA